jgi:photosystem II stability/assembly factor-like uncharacterized protein
VYYSTDNGEYWDTINIGLPEACQVENLAANGQFLAAAIATYGGYPEGGVYRSTNYGQSWDVTELGGPIGYVVFSGTNLFASAGIAKVEPPGMYQSTNDGLSWTTTSTGLSDDAYQFAICFASSAMSLAVGTWGTGVYVSTDAGNVWSSADSGLSSLRVSALAISGQNFVARAGNGIFYSSNGGKKWSETDSGLASVSSVEALAISGSNLFAGTLGGDVYVSTNNAKRWNPMDSGLARASVWSFALLDGELFAATDAGIWMRPITEMVTSVHLTAQVQPTRFQLDQNYPNPFNPTTTIHYVLPEESIVHLTVYNILGQRVETLVSGNQLSGSKSVLFDGSDLPSGIYFYRITSRPFNPGDAASYSDVRKMLLLR